MTRELSPQHRGWMINLPGDPPLSAPRAAELNEAACGSRRSSRTFEKIGLCIVRHTFHKGSESEIIGVTTTGSGLDAMAEWTYRHCGREMPKCEEQCQAAPIRFQNASSDGTCWHLR